MEEFVVNLLQPALKAMFPNLYRLSLITVGACTHLITAERYDGSHFQIMVSSTDKCKVAKAIMHELEHKLIRFC